MTINDPQHLQHIYTLTELSEN